MAVGGAAAREPTCTNNMMTGAKVLDKMSGEGTASNLSDW